MGKKTKKHTQGEKKGKIIDCSRYDISNKKFQRSNKKLTFLEKLGGKFEL